MSEKRKCPRCRKYYSGWAFITGSDLCENCRDLAKLKAKTKKSRPVNGRDINGNTFNNTFINFGTIINKGD